MGRARRISVRFHLDRLESDKTRAKALDYFARVAEKPLRPMGSTPQKPTPQEPPKE